MTHSPPLEIFLAGPPGLEPLLRTEAAEIGFAAPQITAGGVSPRRDWRDVWRANLLLRGAARVLVRIASFRVAHLAQLDKCARHIPWAAHLRPSARVRVEAVCKRSRIYHSGAAAERVARAAAEAVKGTVSPEKADDAVLIMARLERDVCTLSLDTSGALLHKRGFKTDVNAAPLRETLAALFLRACGYTGCEPVVDPMCGSGTFVLEAADIAAGLAPGRARDFAFERLATFDAAAWAALREGAGAQAPHGDPPMAHGFDRDAKAIAISRANAVRAGLSEHTRFEQGTISDLRPPPGGPGLVMVNPPYGGRLGDRARLSALYQALGRILKERFRGWRCGLVTSEEALARATGLRFQDIGPPIPHGALKVRLHQTGPLA